MRKINKLGEPDSWRIYRETPGVVYSATEDLRKSLLKEQGYICAYCMSPIKIKGSRVEHLKCRERYPELALSYNNMVLCCPGCINGEEHCDRLKKALDLSFSPLDSLVERSISYETKSGKIKSSNGTWNDEMNTVLNLNNAMLQLNRSEVIEGLVAALSQLKWKRAKIKSKISEYESFDADGKLKPYCGVVIWYLKKRLREFD